MAGHMELPNARPIVLENTLSVFLAVRKPFLLSPGQRLGDGQNTVYYLNAFNVMFKGHVLFDVSLKQH